MELGNMSSLYTGFLQTQNTTGSKLKETVNNSDYSEASDEELMDVCKQFESFWSRYLRKCRRRLTALRMRAAVPIAIL